MTRFLYLLGFTMGSALAYLLLRLLRPEAEHGEWARTEHDCYPRRTSQQPAVGSPLYRLMAAAADGEN